MAWNLEEATSYYKSQGAPNDQNALVRLLREIQAEYGNGIPQDAVSYVAQVYSIKDTLILAVIRRIPSLRLSDTHILEMCAGANCGKHSALAALGEKLAKERNFTIRFSPCMRMCGKGPNIKWDGVIYHNADEALLRRLTENP